VLSLFCFVRECAIALIAIAILRRDCFFREARRNRGRAKIVKRKSPAFAARKLHNADRNSNAKIFHTWKASQTRKSGNPENSGDAG
jgi:hypothetical protein